MIIVKLSGGLGNQLFQYATGRHLAEKNSADLKLDISDFKEDRFRAFDLDHFNISGKITTSEDLETFRSDDLLNFSWLISKILILMKIKSAAFYKAGKDITIIKEKRFSFDPRVLEARGNIYIDGYWQSEKYFLAIRDVLLQELTIKYESDEETRELTVKIQNTGSVSIHIRRGDYVNNPVTGNYHGICSLEYYLNAVSKITQKIKDCHFYLFSDDISWVKENLKLDYPVTTVSYNDDSRSYKDLLLMSLCKHNIIANSSFSWWGAWLNRNPDKIVIAPRRWFANDDRNNQTKDLIPDKWIRI